jgi:hypothetical protein
LNKFIGIEAIEKKLSAAKVKSPKSEFKISLASVRSLSLNINAAQKMSIIPAKKPIKTSSKDIYQIPPVLASIYAPLVQFMSSAAVCGAGSVQCRYAFFVRLLFYPYFGRFISFVSIICTLICCA